MADDEKNSKIQHIVDLLDITYAAYVSKLHRQHQLFKTQIFAMDFQRQVQALTLMEQLYNRPLSQPTFKIQNIENNVMKSKPTPPIIATTNPNSPTPPYKQYFIKPLTQPITPPIIAPTNPNSPTPPYKQYFIRPLTPPIIALSQPTFKIQNIENNVMKSKPPPIIAPTNPNSPTPPYKQYFIKPLTQPITPPIIAPTNPNSPTPPYKQY
eukprot:345134_1